MVIGWRASYRAAEAFFLDEEEGLGCILDLSDAETAKAPVAAWHKRLSCISLCYQADFAQILRFNIR